MPNSVRQKLLIMGRRITYLLRDEFTTDAAAPMSSPRTAEPGPGTLTITDTAGARFFIASNIIRMNGAPTAGDRLAGMAGYTRAAGLAYYVRVMRDTTYGTDGAKLYSPFVGWSSDGSANGTFLTGITFAIPNFYAIDRNASFLINTLYASASDTFYDMCFVLRSTGGLWFLKVSGVWKLGGILSLGNAATMYPVVAQPATNRHPGAIEGGPGKGFRVAQLGSPFNTDTGFCTTALSGARAANDTFTHEAGSQWIDFTLTTLPAAGNIEIEFRRTDANNCWKLQVTSAGAFSLIEVVGGTPTSRANTAAANGDRLLCAIDGSSALLTRLRSGANANSAIYASVSTFTTQTAGVIATLGTGGAISDLLAWPLNLTGAANTEMNRITS